MTIINRILSGAIAVVALLIVLALALPALQLREPPASAEPLQSVTLGDWSGNGWVNTEQFTTTSREWVIDWTATRAGTAFAFHALVMDAATGRSIQQAASASEPGPGRSFVHAPPGRYYIEFLSSSADWRASVREIR